MSAITTPFTTALAANTLVLVHGFGVDSRHFSPWLPALRDHVNVVTIDLPGFGARADAVFPPTLDALIDELLPLLPERAMYCGWSAGGLVVTHLARRYPARVAGLLLLAVNPSFVARVAAHDVWPGMAPEVFRQFQQAYGDDAAATQRRFERLVTMGAVDARQALREIDSLRAEKTLQTTAITTTQQQAAAQLLRWLGELDYCAVLSDVRQPVTAVYGDNDALVPVACAAALQQLLPSAQVVVAGQCSHWLMRDDAACCTNALLALRERVVVHESAYRRDKREVALAFSRAAARYEDVAQVQAQVRNFLLQRCDRSDDVRAVLDLGCGTGVALENLQQRFVHADLFGADLALGMLQVARERHANVAWLAGDAESLALADGSIERVFSSLALQWCETPAAWLGEIHRVLAPGGRAYIATLGDGTLSELYRAWCVADPGHVHVNAFASVQELHVAAVALGWADVVISEQLLFDRYASLRDVLASIRDIGAHNVNAGRARGLTGRRQLTTLQQVYESFRVDGLLPVSYHVIVLELTKG